VATAHGDRIDVAAFRHQLRKDNFTRATIKSYSIVVRRFLAYVERRAVALDAATPADVTAFVDEDLKLYRRRNGRLPSRLVDWRNGVTAPVHYFLRSVRGTWPPRSSVDDWLDRMRIQLDAGHAVSRTKSRFLAGCRQFLLYLDQKGIALEDVSSADVDTYRNHQVKSFHRKHRRKPWNLRKWIWRLNGPVYGLLRLAQKQWPPPTPAESLVARLRSELNAAHYDPENIPCQIAVVRGFRRFLSKEGVDVTAAQPVHVSPYLEVRLALYRQTHGRSPNNPKLWRYSYTGPIRRVLTLVQGQWPPAAVPSDRYGVHCQELIHRYQRWMTDLQGLSPVTGEQNSVQAKRFLSWLGDRSAGSGLNITVADIDGFLAWRNAGLRRTSRHGVATRLRSFLRFLYADGLIQQDLAKAVSGPTLYRYENIPSALKDEHIRRVLEMTRQDETAAGRRDYAILLLLATYGLRAGEVARLRLEDVDWRREHIRIKHSKTGVESLLPLMNDVGEALLAYLRCRNPKKGSRNVFLRLRAPHGRSRPGVRLAQS
jgi:site-specific recombinase XerD